MASREGLEPPACLYRNFTLVLPAGDNREAY